ncbi:MAG: GNAT family N-acetyltransferase [Deltaproteobacteria bacterium]|nr:GNAT family N-acetyltransferase [Deltaproteobacteria bacterium]MBW2538323.1 GNAT family N-acetyltransferase [Deltaproteobacteria bacterium]
MATSKLAIRQASHDEIETVAEIAARTFRDAFGPDNDPKDMEIYLASAFAPEQIATELADPDSRFLLAYVGAEVVGYAKLKAGEVPDCVRGPSPVELVRLYLDQRVLGKRYGAALIEACFKQARNSGYKTIWLGVWEYNERAQAFYRKWGFIEVGSHAFTVGNDVQTDLIMERQVS